MSEWLVIAAEPRLECRSRDMQDARRVATNDKLRPVDGQLLHAEVDEQKGRPRHDETNLRQRNQLSPVVRIGQSETSNIDRRIPAVPAGAERGDFDGTADFFGQQAGQFVAVGVHPREHKVTHTQQRDAKQNDCAQ